VLNLALLATSDAAPVASSDICGGVRMIRRCTHFSIANQPFEAVRMHAAMLPENQTAKFVDRKNTVEEARTDAAILAGCSRPLRKDPHRTGKASAAYTTSMTCHSQEPINKSLTNIAAMGIRTANRPLRRKHPRAAAATGVKLGNEATASRRQQALLESGK
jgi:hypothetical protein